MRTHPKLIAAVIVLLALFGAECVRAAINHHDTTVVAIPSYAFVPAEVDPIFQQKLAQRVRAPTSGLILAAPKCDLEPSRRT